MNEVTFCDRNPPVSLTLLRTEVHTINLLPQEKLYLVQFRGMQAAEASWQSITELSNPAVVHDWLANELPANFYPVGCPLVSLSSSLHAADLLKCKCTLHTSVHAQA